LLLIPSTGNKIHSAAYGSYIPLQPGQATAGKLDAEAVEPQNFTTDTVCWMASCTKLMTTVAALQCVERRLLCLDTDITDVLPELKDIDILLKMVDDGSGGKKPVLKKSKGMITLRCVYDVPNLIDSIH
jgi:CubicO group peptidase (beta-lactamase class C family)